MKTKQINSPSGKLIGYITWGPNVLLRFEMYIQFSNFILFTITYCNAYKYIWGNLESSSDNTPNPYDQNLNGESGLTSYLYKKQKILIDILALLQCGMQIWKVMVRLLIGRGSGFFEHCVITSWHSTKWYADIICQLGKAEDEPKDVFSRSQLVYMDICFLNVLNLNSFGSKWLTYYLTSLGSDTILYTIGWLFIS